MELKNRRESIRIRLCDAESDAIVITKTSNVIYLTGLIGVFDEAADVACVITPEETLLFTTFIYARPAGPAAEGGAWDVREIRGGFYEGLCGALNELGLETLSVESSVPYGRFRFLSEHFGGRVDPVDQWVEDLRVVKDAEEIRRIEAAATLTDEGFAYILQRAEAGRSEREIALDLEVYLRTNGSEGVAFAPIVASGPNSANPHATVTDRVLGPGDALKLDFGARVDGYCADMTRTIAVGEPHERLVEMHDVVLRANQAGIAGARAGRKASDIDADARAVVQAAGYGDEFGHSLGHGVGLDVHEAPRVSATNTDSVPAGAVVTVEPGIYVWDFAGVRIEDLVAVGDDGPRVLSTASRELLVV